MRDQFIDPAGVKSTYDFLVNHSDEQDGGQGRTVSHLANTGNVGLVRSQGDKVPMVLSWTGTILHASQHEEMWEWVELCEDQSIYVRDFAGDKYEVLITSFKPARKRTAHNRNDPTIPFHYWTYSLEMEVLAILEGDLAGVVSP
jgi:hypothetical protein